MAVAKSDSKPESIMSQDVRKAAQQLLDTLKSVQLATLNAQGEPEASYAPCLIESQRVYLFLSQLASHTQNLLRTPVCSLMWIADEQSSRNLFARERLILQCRSEVIPSDSEVALMRLDAMEARQGPTLSLLRSLPDFQLFQLSPTSGRFIQGFGAAYTFELFDLDTLTPVSGR